MNKKGFTLVEMLVSFALVSVIAGIMMNVLFMLSDKSDETETATELSVLQSNLVKTIKNDLVTNTLTSVVSCAINCYDLTYSTIGTKRLQITDTTVTYGDFVKDLPDGVEIKYHMVGTNKYTSSIPTGKNSLLTIKIPFSIDGSDKNYDLVISHQFNYASVSKITLNDYSGANEPVLLSGMIPIKWTGISWVKSNESWFNYDNKEWANVALVSSATRATYVAAANGTVINEADVMAYFVWIPRYKYKLFNTASTYSTTALSIEIQFQKSTDTKSTGTTNGEWLTHPAFTYDVDELKGIWVGKFETTGTTATPTIKPGITSLRSQTLSTFFTTAQVFNNVTTYGIPATADSHVMKNIEWGAVAYLTNSVYGKNAEVIKNNSSSYLTGCTGYDSLSASYAGCQNSYFTENGQKGSTTGNIYGIYDMAGGAYNAVMNGVYTDGTNTNLIVSFSGFVQATISAAAFSKYIDKYSYSTSSTSFSRRILGDATGETYGWNSDSIGMANSPTSSFFDRGDYYANTTSAGIFSTGYKAGASNAQVSFSTVIPGK